MQECLDRIRIVLVNTSHSGNIGSVARAMKNMGLSKLVLVNPKATIDSQAISMASGADDILESVEIVSELKTAVAPCALVMGASARKRKLGTICKSSRECMQDVVKYNGQEIAIVFGSEHSGLTNEELNMCHIHIAIPTNPNFSSLNLSQAVQVMCYEVYLTVSELYAGDVVTEEEVMELASAAEVEGLQEHFAEVMQQIGFLNPAQPKKLAARVRRLLYKANLEHLEVNILRGFLAMLQKKLSV